MEDLSPALPRVNLPTVFCANTLMQERAAPLSSASPGNPRGLRN
jgi:hypothetical protein